MSDGARWIIGNLGVLAMVALVYFLGWRMGVLYERDRWREGKGK